MIRQDSTAEGSVIELVTRRRQTRLDDVGTIPEPPSAVSEAVILRALAAAERELQRVALLVAGGLLTVAVAVAFAAWLVS